MTALARQPGSSLAIEWQPDAIRLLDEHHLIAVSDSPVRRGAFTASLARWLSGLRDAEVCTLRGRAITDLASFCTQLERSLSEPEGQPIDRRIDGARGITTLLRTRTAGNGRTKFRFYIWQDADVLLQEDPVLFGRLVDALAGIAAEAEHADDDLLLIHRAIFIGSEALACYADDPDGQFQAWARDGRYEEPLWQAITGIERPDFAQYPIDELAW